MDNRDTQRHNKNVTKRLAQAVNQTSFTSEKDNIAITYILEKTLRISAAVVRLASIMDTHSSIRDGLESTSIRLVKDVSYFRTNQESRTHYIHDTIALIAVLETAVLAQVLSEKNVSIVLNEVEELLALVKHLDLCDGGQLMTDEMMQVDFPAQLLEGEVPLRTQRTFNRHVETEQMIQRPHSEYVQGQAPSMHQKDSDQKITGQYKDRVQEVQKDRRATILGLMQKKDRITVRDVANVIKDCSEKTIQRELLALVAQGVLKKEGERRWSSYVLV